MNQTKCDKSDCMYRDTPNNMCKYCKKYKYYEKKGSFIQWGPEDYPIL